MRKATVLLTMIGLNLATLFSATSTTSAQSDTSGTVTIESISIAIGLGLSWGDGVLEYRGQTYLVTVRGLGVTHLGVSTVTTRGVVQNLNKLEDFGGNYVLARTSVDGGAGVAALKNQKGVEMALTPPGQGVRLALAQGGVEMRLK